MNQRKAKAIRKTVYGDYSQRDTQYIRRNGAIRCTGLRAVYLKAKKNIKNSKK